MDLHHLHIFKFKVFKTYLVRMTVVLHEHIKLLVENVLCSHNFAAQKDTRAVAISFECLIFCEKLEDIQMQLQLSYLLSAIHTCEQNTFPMCKFIMQHSSYFDKIAFKLNL